MRVCVCVLEFIKSRLNANDNLHYHRSLGKGMNPIILPPAMGK